MHAAATQRQPIALANANEDSATNGTFARQNTTQKTLNRPREREIPSQIQQIVPESAMYMKLSEYEQKIDTMVQRKKLQVQNAIYKPQTQTRSLRIFISNLAHDQEWQRATRAHNPSDLVDDAIPAWTLKIEGRLLDVRTPTHSKAVLTLVKLPGNQKKYQLPGRFSDFVKAVYVDAERDAQVQPVEWRKPAGLEPCDGFEIKRTGHKDVAIKICIFLEHVPERFTVSGPLADLIGISGLETRSGVLQKLWAYVKAHKLHDTEDKRVINCDSAMASVFGQPKIMLPQLGELIGNRLSPPEPIVIDYVVKLGHDKHESSEAYDVQVEIDMNKHKPTFLDIEDEELAKLNERLTDVIRDLDTSRLRRDFFLSFAEDPMTFIDRWMASQSRDLEVILGDGNVNMEEVRRSAFYDQSFVEDAVLHYLQR